MALCENCKTDDANIYVTMLDGKSRQLCRECNNKITAEYAGINLTLFENGIYEFAGIRGKKHNFKIERIVYPMGIVYEAVEITKDGTPGYRVAVMGHLDSEQQDLFLKLDAKIRKTVSKRYLENRSIPYAGNQVVLKEDVAVGRFEYDEHNDGIHKVVIDGQAFSWDELGRMLSAYEGFQFKLEIYDISDDVE